MIRGLDQKMLDDDLNHAEVYKHYAEIYKNAAVTTPIPLLLQQNPRFPKLPVECNELEHGCE
jgi:hypothetical protein